MRSPSGSGCVPPWPCLRFSRRSSLRPCASVTSRRSPWASTTSPKRKHQPRHRDSPSRRPCARADDRGPEPSAAAGSSGSAQRRAALLTDLEWGSETWDPGIRQPSPRSWAELLHAGSSSAAGHSTCSEDGRPVSTTTSRSQCRCGISISSGIDCQPTSSSSPAPRASGRSKALARRSINTSRPLSVFPRPGCGAWTSCASPLTPTNGSVRRNAESADHFWRPLLEPQRAFRTYVPESSCYTRDLKRARGSGRLLLHCQPGERRRSDLASRCARADARFWPSLAARVGG